MVAQRRWAASLSSLQPVAIVVFTLTLVALAIGVVALRLTAPWDGTEVPIQWNSSAGVAENGVDASAIAAHSVVLPDEHVWAIDGLILSELLRPPVDLRPIASTSYEYELTSASGARVATQPLEPFPAVLLVTGDMPSMLSQLGFLLIGGFVFVKRPRDPAAQLLLLLAALFIPGAFWRWVGVNDIYAGPVLSYMSLLEPLYFLGLGLIVPFVAVFPRPAEWARRHSRLLLAAVLLAPIAAVITLVDAQLSTLPTFAWMDRLATIELLTYASAGAAVLVIVPVRYRTLTDPSDRRRLLAVLGTIAVVVAILLAVWIVPSILFGRVLLPWPLAGVVALPIPLAMGFAILRYGAFDIQRLVNRSLVYTGLTTAIALIYIVLVGMAVLNIHEKFGFAVALLATGLVIVIAQPLRDWLQRAVNRLMYGDRDDPYQGIVRLNERLDTSLATSEVLPTVVETVARSLRLPYVAVERRVDGEAVIAASTGKPVADPVVVQLAHKSENVGRLLLAPRAGEDGFSDADRRLLAALATQVSSQLKTLELDDELRRSRERLVATREEERRQLRRELHDDIGPALAGSLLQLQAARAAIAEHPEQAAELISQLETETRQAITDIRRIARDLRPPALDDLGLVGALRAQVSNFSADSSLQVDLDVPEVLPQLPAAIEVAVYRIVLEALANVARHAHASNCWITLRYGDASANEPGVNLVVSISDDGLGIPRGRGNGVGLRSMRERTTELGGTFSVGRRRGGGTAVTARLPLRLATPVTAQTAAQSGQE